MGSPFVGEIRMFGGTFAPAGWMFCDGSLLPISQNDVLFQLIGTTYGGDGQETFALPDLRSRVPLHMGTGKGGTYTIGENGGVETVTLTTPQIAIHNHPLLATKAGQQLSPANNTTLAMPTSSEAGVAIYGPGPNNVTINPNTIGLAGGSQAHDNIQPYLAITYIISLFGIFPSPT